MVLLETQRKRPTRVQLPSNSTAALRSGRGATTSPVRLSVVWFPASVSYRARPVSFRLYTKDSSSQFAAAGGIKFPTIAPNSRRRRRGGPGGGGVPPVPRQLRIETSSRSSREAVRWNVKRTVFSTPSPRRTTASFTPPQERFGGG